MGRRRISTLTALALFLGAALLLGVAVQAGTTIVSRTGDLVDVEPVSSSSDPGIMAIRIRTTSATGQQIDEVIQSTDDAIDDAGPSISLAPFDGQPVVVWSRFDGSDYELAISHRSEESGWPAHVLLTSNSTNDSMPEFAVDSQDRVHVLWWGNGAGAPLSFQSFSSITGEPIGPVQDPFNPPRRIIRLRSPDPSTSGAGGLDDPGVITSRIVASTEYCVSNPGAPPEHGVIATCEIGRPTVYQYSNCQLSVSIYSPALGQWKVTTTDLSTANLSGSAIREIVQGMTDAACH